MSKGPTANASAVNIPITVATPIVTVIPPNVRQDVPSYNVNIVGQNAPNQTVQGVANYTPGTGSTAVGIRCVNEQGTVIGSAQTEITTAGVPDDFPFMFLDNSGVQTGSYQITFTPTGATAAGTVNVVNAYSQTDG